MGISDWSSDVCSSDLARKPGGEAASIGDRVASGSSVRDRAFATRVGSGADGARHLKKSGRYLCGDAAMKFAFIEQHASTWPVKVMCRSEERSVWKECVSTGSSWLWPYI